MRKIWTWLFISWSLASADVAAQVDRIELGYQTTNRGIVWYRPGLPTHVPYWQFSRDTNAVMWHDTLTAIRYDWDYADDRWRAKGTFSGPLPPPAQATSGATIIDYRTAYWIRDTFNLLHKYDSTANAWTPWGDWFYLSSVPTDIAATGSNGAAKYTRSLWQNSGTFEVRYWDGDSWEPFGSTADGSETIVTAGTGISVTGTGTIGTPYIVTNTGDLSSTNELQTLANTSAATTHTVTLSNSGGSVQLAEGTNVTLTTTGTTADGIVTISASDDSGGGIYGDGTPTSGNDTLPSGGSTVTLPDQWQPLQFNAATSAGQVWSALVVNAATCSDDRFTKYLVGKSPSDSLEIYGYDCGSILKATGGQLTMQTDKELINIADSIYMATVPDKTTLGGIVGFTQFGSYLSQIKGTATDQVLKWNNTGAGYWYPGTAGGGTVTGAENGLSVVSDKIRLGGNLITAATSIEGDGNELRFFDGKLSVSSWTGYANTPVQPIRFQALEADPTLNSSPTLDGIIEYRLHNSVGSDQSNSMTIGGYSNDADGMWIQSRSASVPSVEYPLSMQPRGGLFSVGRMGALDAVATFAGSALSGTNVAGNVMHLENTGGNAKAAMSMGVGTDILDSEIGYFDGADALRVTNRNATTGTSSVRIAVGGETSDKVIVTSSTVTPNARMGVGHTATTTVKSTIDNKGSYAAAINQTTGNLTLTEAHHTVRYTLNASPTFTLPSAIDCPGREYIIHHFGSAGNIILSQNVISSTGTTFNTVPARNWAYIQSDGSDWYGYRLQSL